MNAQTTLNAAIAAGYDRLSTRDVMLCVLQGAGSGGGGGAASDSIAYAGPPTDTPTNLGIQNIVVDVNGQQWQYYGGAWH